MRDNCVIFTNNYRQQLRVVFDPDGTAFFCGPDLAVIAGYEAPQKAVTGGNKGVNRIDSVLRRVPWDNGVRRGRCDYTCFSAENAVKFLCRRPAPYDNIRWFEDEVLPKTQEIGEEVARGFVKWPDRAKKRPEQKTGEEPPAKARASYGAKLTGVEPDVLKDSIYNRLDAIILECAMLKRDLYQIK